MKRSAQVALLLGGLTTAGAASYAMAPPRRDCPAPTAAAAATAAQTTTAPGLAAPSPGTAPPAAAAPQRPEDCRPRRRWGSWAWGPGYGDSRGSRRYWPGSSRTNIAPTSPTARSRTATRGTPARTSRGGFGSTGRSVGRSSS